MTTVNGLPAHVLLVHAVVVLVPLSAVLVVLCALWPAARGRLAVLTAVLAVLALASVPLTTDAGEWLEHRIPRSPLVQTHTELGDSMLPWAIGLAVVAVAVAARELLARRGTSTGREGPGAAIATHARPAAGGPGGAVAGAVLALLAVVVAVGAVYTVYEIGESGARAAWTGQFSPTPLPRPAGEPGPPPGEDG